MSTAPTIAPNWQWQYVKPGLGGQFTTPLSAQDEPKFQQWVKQNKVPWQDEPHADYDMRGFLERDAIESVWGDDRNEPQRQQIALHG